MAECDFVQVPENDASTQTELVCLSWNERAEHVLLPVALDPDDDAFALLKVILERHLSRKRASE